MPRIGEFCSSNVARYLLAVVIILGLLVTVGVLLFYSTGKGHPIDQPGGGKSGELAVHSPSMG